MNQVNPYLNFVDQTQEAFGFYHSVFGGDAPSFVTYGDMGGGEARHAHLIAHASLPMGGGTVLMGSDVSDARAEDLRVGTNVQIFLAAEDLAEGQRLFDGLAAGGTVTMPYERTSWAERFGSCIDRFGIHWTIDYTGEVRFDAA